MYIPEALGDWSSVTIFDAGIALCAVRRVSYSWKDVASVPMHRSSVLRNL